MAAVRMARVESEAAGREQESREVLVLLRERLRCLVGVRML
jgi:hypothetical protein